LLNKYSSFATKVKIAAGAPAGDYACTVLAINTGDTSGNSQVVASQDIIITVK